MHLNPVNTLHGTDLLTGALCDRWSIIIGFVFVFLADLVAWVFSPKGENRTLVQTYLPVPLPILLSSALSPYGPGCAPWSLRGGCHRNILWNEQDAWMDLGD